MAVGFLSIAIGGVSTTTSAFAQTETEVLEEVVVTGSHIRRDAFSSSAPLSVIDSQMIEGVGVTSAGDLLSRLPSIVSDVDGSSDNAGSTTDSGIYTTALRNLQSSRTLVLVDGRRFVSGVAPSSGYGVDLNTIPTAIIERIEVLTGGQSAVYGSDAIAGVVNIILKDDFEGMQFDAQTSMADGDGRRTDLNFTIGGNMGSLNAWGSIGYSDDDGILSSEREFSAVSQWSIDTDGDGLLDTLDYLGSGFIPESRFVGGGVDIKGDGTPYNAREDSLNFNEFRSLRLPMERKFAAAGMNLGVNESTEATIEINYARVESVSAIESVPFRVPRDVYFVQEGGTTGIDLATHPLFAGSTVGAQLLGAGITSLDSVTTFERIEEFGPVSASNIRSTFRAVAALDFDYANGMHLSVYGTYGITEQNQSNTGDINVERAASALDIEPDGFGGYQCADEIARLQGCVPYNPFDTLDSIAGQAGVTGYSEDAIAYLSANGGILASIEQSVLSAVLTGDLSALSFGSGTSSYALGVEYRNERGVEVPDELRQQGIARLLQLQPTDGRYDVTEVFGELNIPVADWLVVDVAGRYGDYSTIGGASSWRLGLNAPVNDSVRVRATLATAVRAPNISDLYAGATENVNLLFDPCNRVDNATTGVVAENCRSIPAIQNRIDATGSFTLTQVETQSTDGYTIGSPTVSEETADSYTLGIVYTPVAMSNLSLAVDFYSIKIDDVIRVPDGSVTLDRCHNTDPGSFDPSCGGLVIRDVNRGPLLEVYSITNNEDKMETSGIDLEASVDFGGVGPGELTLTAIANFLTEFKVIGSAGDVQDLQGEVLYPETRAVLNAIYDINSFNLFAQIRYRSETKDRNNNSVQDDRLNTMDSETYLDLRGAYNFGNGLNVYLGVNNAFDTQPPSMGFSHKYYQQAINSNGTAFDTVGRQIYLGLNFAF